LIEVIGVRLNKYKRLKYYLAGDMHLAINTPIIVDSDSTGLQFTRVCLTNKLIDEQSISKPLKDIVRIADDSDEKVYKENLEREKVALEICKEKILKSNFNMKLISVNLSFDRKKIVFYFSASGRIDFRVLVKELASIFKMRIELRQIGVRDETSLLKGMGSCGRTLCCGSFLNDFQPVSIKMAKDQKIPLNPNKISGACGRLMCCLRYEQESYEDLNRAIFFTEGDMVNTPDGPGLVLSIYTLRQLVKIELLKAREDDIKISIYAVEELARI
jgi:cell fate regulator YaaT (PSP1 superfamily)